MVINIIFIIIIIGIIIDSILRIKSYKKMKDDIVKCISNHINDKKEFKDIKYEVFNSLACDKEQFFLVKENMEYMLKNCSKIGFNENISLTAIIISLIVAYTSINQNYPLVLEDANNINNINNMFYLFVYSVISKLIVTILLGKLVDASIDKFFTRKFDKYIVYMNCIEKTKFQYGYIENSKVEGKEVIEDKTVKKINVEKQKINKNTKKKGKKKKK